MERAQPNSPSTLASAEVGPGEKDQLAKSRAADHHRTPAGRERRRISRQQIINKINLLNFQERTLSLIFRHHKYRRIIRIAARPLPCKDHRLVCTWDQEVDINKVCSAYRFQCFHITLQDNLIEVRAGVEALTDRQIRLLLPETGREIGTRKTIRHKCRGITAFLLQNGALFLGELVDFCAHQFRVALECSPPQTFQWIDPENPVSIVLTGNGETLYSSDCKITARGQGQLRRHFVIEPLRWQCRRFKPKEFRSLRLQLTPSPNGIFTHPFFGRTTQLKVHDVSGCGFSLEEYEHEAVLLPGMIIPKIELQFSDGSTISCMAQVVFSRPHRRTPKGQILRCGLAILDMDMDDHNRLLAILQQVKNANMFLSTKVDLDDLWDFFFETGFVYPQKYCFIEANKEKIKAVYKKLYTETPRIANHFIYQENGRILGHMAMVRYYEKAWLIHHHAAIRSSYNRGGLMVFNQINQYINDSHRLYSLHMDYVFCYFRPQNKFPNQVFGGAARHIDDRSKCSLDTFAYFHLAPARIDGTGLPLGWQLGEVQKEDLLDLQTYYEAESGGLMIRAFDLLPDTQSPGQLAGEYQKLGLVREKHLFALRHEGELNAVILANISDTGLNMSDLTNSITFFALDGNKLSSEVVIQALAEVGRCYQAQEIPVMLFPCQLATALGLAAEKDYSLWVLNLDYTDECNRFFKRLLKFIHRG